MFAGAVREGQPEDFCCYGCVGFIRAFRLLVSNSEITELVLLDKSERNIAILNQLRALGVRISMDGFRHRLFLALPYLRKFPFDKIKSIDQFVCTGRAGGRKDSPIVRAIADLELAFLG